MRVNAADYKLSTRDSADDKFYTVNGSESFIDEDGDPRTTKDSNNIYAKAIKSYASKDMQNKTLYYRYYILTDSNNNLYNPVDESSLLSITTKNQSYINKVCKNEQIFTEVTQSVFNQYISFLRTKSKKFLVAAQREI
jgi:hypothetical protein